MMQVEDTYFCNYSSILVELQDESMYTVHVKTIAIVNNNRY